MVCGVGINDADYKVVNKEKFIDHNGNVCIRNITCPFYRAWADMLSRCYRENTICAFQVTKIVMSVMNGNYFLILKDGWNSKIILVRF